MKIVTESHLDHALSPAHVDFIMATFGDRRAFFLESVDLPAHLDALPCGLHGPSTGDLPVPDDECRMIVRGARRWPSRVCGRAPKLSRQLTVIAGPLGDEPCVLFTAYGGPAAPREPGDDSLDDDRRPASVAFWAVHALSA